jgi:hypothetical protein
MRVYFLGSFSKGASHMAKTTAQKYGVHLIPEIARLILQEKEMTFSELRKDVNLVNEYQKEVLTRQLEIEREYTSFVSPRGIDSIAFFARHGTELAEFRKTDIYKEYVEWVKTGYNFLLMPHKELLTNDGVRDLDYDESLMITGAVRQVLEMEGIPYTIINPLSQKDRESIVDKVLQNVSM